MSTREQQTQIFDHYYDYEGDYEINDETDLMDQSYSTDSYLDSSKNSSKSNESIDEVDDANNHWHRRRHKFSPIPRKRRQFPSNLHTCTTDVVKKKEVHIFNQQQNKKGDFTKTHIYYKEVSTLKKTNHPKEIGLISKIILILFLILLSIFVTYTYVMPTTTNTDLIIVNNRKLCNLSRIESKFPNQNQKLWRAIKIGIETTINDDPTKPSVYLFVYNDGKTVSRFMEQIIYLARNCMETSIDPIVLSRNDLSGIEMKNDYGVVIAEYQSKLLNSGVLLVNDLDQIPASVAQAFHFICDTESPLVRRLIVFATIYINTFDRNRELLMHVENNLKSNWSSLRPNIIDPLLARLTHQVLFLAPEGNE